MVKELSNVEMWIIDILPQRVPENSKGQYFRIEQFYLDKKRIENSLQGFKTLAKEYNL